VFGYQIAGAVSHGVHGNPVDTEPQFFQARGQDVFDRQNSCKMHGAAVGVDELPKQSEVGGIVGIDVGGHALFDGGQ
jgi:hypothetical protein